MADKTALTHIKVRINHRASNSHYNLDDSGQGPAQVGTTIGRNDGALGLISDGGNDLHQQPCFRAD